MRNKPEEILAFEALFPPPEGSFFDGRRYSLSRSATPEIRKLVRYQNLRLDGWYGARCFAPRNAPELEQRVQKLEKRFKKLKRKMERPNYEMNIPGIVFPDGTLPNSTEGN